MHIRLANRADVPAILDISNWAALHTPANFAIEPESLESWLESFDDTHRMHPWLVAESESRAVIGFAKSSPFRSRCAYAWSAEVTVYVHPEHHGRGIGTALYQQLIPMLKAQGYVTLIAGITMPNPASQKLHEAFGFRAVGELERVGWKFDRWHNVGFWEAMLRDDSGTPPGIRAVAEIVAEVWEDGGDESKRPRQDSNLRPVL